PPHHCPPVPRLLALCSYRLCRLSGTFRPGACLLGKLMNVVQFQVYSVHAQGCYGKKVIEFSLVLGLDPARHPLRRGEMGKEGFRGVAMRQCLNKTMPLIHPVVPTTALTLFLSMHTGNREVTHLTPPQRLS